MVTSEGESVNTPEDLHDACARWKRALEHEGALPLSAGESMLVDHVCSGLLSFASLSEKERQVFKAAIAKLPPLPSTS
jgi:hypothetical protein